MMNRTRSKILRLAALTSCWLLPVLAAAQTVYTPKNAPQNPRKARYALSLRFYQDQNELAARIGNKPEPLAAYAKALEAVVAAWEKNAHPTAKGLIVAVGVKPGPRSRIWCEPALGGTIAPAALRDLEQQLSAVPPMAVTGPIAIGLQFVLFGREVEAGPASAKDAQAFPGLPQTWVAAAKGRPSMRVPDDLFQVIWRN